MINRVTRYCLPFAILCALAAVASGVGYRLGWWSLGVGFGVLRWAAYVAIVATALAIAAVLVSRPQPGRQGLASALIALVVGVATFAIPGMMLIRAKQLPPIHDITTDTSNPPAFVAVLPLRANARNSPEYGGPSVAEQQQRAYPTVVPYESKLPPDEAFTRALETAKAMRWDIVASVPAEGRIEATDTTLLFGFKDDIVIRVASSPQGSRVDIRSESRIGGSDVGKNASRIERFLDKMKRSG
jgi:uncharacterized protein (DUF1499 family)